MEVVTDFIFLGSKITVVTAAVKLKTLAPLKESFTNLNSVLKSRDITLQTKVCIVKAMFFPEVMNRCDS